MVEVRHMFRILPLVIISAVLVALVIVAPWHKAKTHRNTNSAALTLVTTSDILAQRRSQGRVTRSMYRHRLAHEAAKRHHRKRPPFGRVKTYAYKLVGEHQFKCLNILWTRESGWQRHNLNPSSGAYGIPQALPGWKMASAGRDWHDNPFTQVRWGIRYIRKTYGSMCHALDHSNAYGWY